MGGPLDVIADPTISVEEAAARSGGTDLGEHAWLGMSAQRVSRG